MCSLVAHVAPRSRASRTASRVSQKEQEPEKTTRMPRFYALREFLVGVVSGPRIQVREQGMNEMQTLNLLGVVTSAAARLSERCTQEDRHLLCALLSSMLQARPAFERLSAAFRAGTEGCDEDVELVRTMLDARISLDLALVRIDDSSLDDFAEHVDAELAPFEDALYMLDVSARRFEERYEGIFTDPDRWWGFLARHTREEDDLACDLYEIRERCAAAKISAQAAVSNERATWCMRLAKAHLDNLYWRRSRFDLDVTASWDSHGVTRPDAVYTLAGRLARSTTEKLERFDRHVGFSY